MRPVHARPRHHLPRPAHAGNGIHGGFATHVRVPSADLCPVDEERLAAAGPELADVSVVADALTTPYQAAIQSEIRPGELAIVIVIGIGGVGGYAVQVAAALGATVVAVDVDPARLARMRSQGAALTLDARETGGEQSLRRTERKIFECSGSAAGQANAFGQVALKPFVRQHPLDEVDAVLAAAHALDEGLLASLNEALAEFKLHLVARNPLDSPYAGAIGAAPWGAFRYDKLLERGVLATAG